MDIRAALRRYGDLLVAVALATVFVLEVLGLADADLSRAVPGALLAALSQALRRRTPLVAFLLTWTGNYVVLYYAPRIDNDSIAFIIIVFLSLYSLGRHTAGYELWLGAVAVVACIVGFLIGDGGALLEAGDIGFAVLFIGTPWAAGLGIRLRREHEALLSARNVQLQQEQEERARRAVAAERSRIARELHDVVSHAISVTVLQARGGRKMLGVDEKEVRRALDAIEHTNAQALGDMRRLLSLLRDTEDEPSAVEDGVRANPQPSLNQLDSLLTHVRSSGLPVELAVSGEPTAVPPGVDLSAYRIIQEALTNALKHAGPAAEARVEVTYGSDDLQVCVSDNGLPPDNGAAQSNGHGHGLIGIRERVAVVGGHVESGPIDSGGFAVRARLPYAVET